MLLASDGSAMTPATASSTTSSRMAPWWRAECPTKLIDPRRPRLAAPARSWRRPGARSGRPPPTPPPARPRRGRGAVGKPVLAAHHHRFAGRDPGEDLRLAAGDDAPADLPPVRLG